MQWWMACRTNCVIESWLQSGNPKCLPETEAWTFTRSALDLTHKVMRIR